MWERQIFAWNLLKTTYICFLHFSQIYNKFLVLFKSTCILPRGLKKISKFSMLAKKRVYFRSEVIIYLHFPGEISCFEMISYFPFRIYINRTISIKKLFIKWFKNTWKQSWNSKSKVTSKSAGACSAHNPPAKLSIFCYSQLPTDQKVM